MTRWQAFWFPQVDPVVLGRYRICLGLFLLAYYVILAPSWLVYYGHASIPSLPGCAPRGLNPPALSLLWYVPSDQVMWGYYAVSIGCAACLLLGVGGKWPILWLWISNYAILFRNQAVSDGEEQVLALLLFPSLFLPLNAAWTAPQLLRRWRGAGAARAQPPITSWALRFAQVHFALIYAISLPFKLASDVAWRDGTLVYYAMMSMTFARWPGLELFSWAHGFVSRVATCYTVAIEGLFPLLVWVRRCQRPVVLAAMGLHLVLAVFLGGLMVFNLTMLLGLTLFLPGRRNPAVD